MTRTTTHLLVRVGLLNRVTYVWEPYQSQKKVKKAPGSIDSLSLEMHHVSTTDITWISTDQMKRAQMYGNDDVST